MTLILYWLSILIPAETFHFITPIFLLIILILILLYCVLHSNLAINFRNHFLSSNLTALHPFVSCQNSNSDVISKFNSDYSHVNFSVGRLTEQEAVYRSKCFYQFLNERRSLRYFSKETVPFDIISNCILTAGTSPSGAHCQPWTFVVVQDPIIKSQIREAVENEERINYNRRMDQDWLQSVFPLVSDLHLEDIKKPYLEDAPYLIIVMKQKYGINPQTGCEIMHYYSMESVCIATGLLVAALHNANLVTITTTPMNAEISIRNLCRRPENERVLFLMPVGYPSKDARVPYRDKYSHRKKLPEIMHLI